ncbi:hypothetical protein JCM3775_006112 [Rhodotorula graminis]|uniref:RED-like N-terminal domain-containing protein n=1 Tax=Rhodotorula graminis (strain WP1) TaxID=578459 RepID=A0A194S4Y4_RHOGW|nr:uncharacterized protein RHOBADRAFT_54291 [Rhodotorula graminis WP1]KPV74476.1 hypothetical protein RHOBADRAFT_54291 [Rhodotorula graminis WP1]
MNQDAFRQLLATPGAAASSSTAKPRAWGAPPPKPKASSGPVGKATDFAPRKKAARKPKKGPDGELYRDRAKERRLGKEGDFAQAEKMLEDLKSRETYSEEQLQYLGGDAHHSVLVKGLDHALLARKKHEAALEADAELDDVEDALDEAFDAQPAAPSLPATGEARGGSSGAPAGKGKSRNELLAELKAMRGGAEGGAAVVDEAGKGQPGRFKPIGADRKGKGKEGAAGPGAGWKSVGGAGGDAGGEKKRRKKKKVAPGGDDSAATASAAPPGPAVPPPPPPQPAAPPPPPLDDFDDDADIFGDVGEYGGLGDDSDSDDEAGAAPRLPPPAPPVAAAGTAASTSAKRKYFDDDDADDLDLSTAPSAVADLAAKQAAADAAAALAGDEGGASDGDGEGAHSGDDESLRKPTRLQGLSSSKGPSARDLLEMDKEAEAEDKRKAKKAKRREKADERERTMTDADRSNRDFQEMDAYLKRKAGGGKDKDE